MKKINPDSITRPASNYSQAVIIPTHYLNETTTYSLSTLEPADEWVKSQKSFKMLDNASLNLAAADVAKMDREFMYFGHNVQTA